MPKLSHPRVALVILAGLFIISPFLVFAETMFSGGPSDARSGAPGETDCTACHAGTVNSGDGSLQLSGLPTGYEPGKTYTITVTLEDPGQQRWGFEMTAIDEAGDGAGSFVITDAVNTQLSDNPAPARDYVKQTSTGTYNATPDGPVSWQVDWTAPSTAPTSVTFYAAGNAANGNNGTSGDEIYTTSFAASVFSGIPALTDAGVIALILLVMSAAVFTIVRKRRFADHTV